MGLFLCFSLVPLLVLALFRDPGDNLDCNVFYAYKAELKCNEILLPGTNLRRTNQNKCANNTAVIVCFEREQVN